MNARRTSQKNLRTNEHVGVKQEAQRPFSAVTERVEEASSLKSSLRGESHLSSVGDPSNLKFWHCALLDFPTKDY
jgi:hypothetical protein